MHFEVTERWRSRWPNAVVACMLMTDVPNPERNAALEKRLGEVEQRLRDRYAGIDRVTLRGLPPFAAYERYYKQFGQTYHVWRQIESVATKGKPIPRRAALVEAVFAEELASGILTAVHDAAVTGQAIVADVADGSETMSRFDGSVVRIDAGDMFMRDEAAVLSSIIRGPAAYGMVTPVTTKAVVTVYAPDGIGVEPVRRHLDAIAGTLRLISPDADMAFLEIVSA